MNVYPLLKLKVFVDDITAYMEVRNKELPGSAEKVLKSIRREEEEKGMKLSITEKKGRARCLCIVQLPERSFKKCRKREGVGLATGVDTLGVDLRTKTEQL